MNPASEAGAGDQYGWGNADPAHVTLCRLRHGATQEHCPPRSDEQQGHSPSISDHMSCKGIAVIRLSAIGGLICGGRQEP
jgi:hypothetical protein